MSGNYTNRTIGIDGITKEEYGRSLEENINALIERLKKKSYENLFNPREFDFTNCKAKFIPGVEICCNYWGAYIEILGYDFEPENENLSDIISYKSVLSSIPFEYDLKKRYFMWIQRFL